MSWRHHHRSMTPKPLAPMIGVRDFGGMLLRSSYMSKKIALGIQDTHTFPKVFSVSPISVAAIAIANVPTPSHWWIGRYQARWLIARPGKRNVTKPRTHCNEIECQYSAPPISHGYFSPNNSRKTPVPCPLGRDMGVFHEFEVWPKF